MCLSDYVLGLHRQLVQCVRVLFACWDTLLPLLLSEPEQENMLYMD